MADITAKKDVRRQPGEVLSFVVKNDEVIYEGALVAIDSNGEAINAGDDSGATFAGVADETVDNSDDGLEIKVRMGGVIDCVAAFSAAAANVGDEVCLSDNQSVDLAANTTNDVYCGRIVEVVSASKVRVALRPFGGKTSDLDT